MMNKSFRKAISLSFSKYLKTNSRSNQKLVILHGKIANDLQVLLGNLYKVKSLGINDNKETKIIGKYIDKKVDITIVNSNEKPIAGIAVKFVMSNFFQNANNYFENMLGETANIRSNKVPYFQILILPSKIPYFNNKGDITKWEELSENILKKYFILSNDNTDIFMHIPNKTLIYIIDTDWIPNNITNKDNYKEICKSLINEIKCKNIEMSYQFGDNIIYNDYESFIKKIFHYIKSI
ncbi:hypothetical protein RRG43_00440 [Mycoplasmopsis cynos]|uniref:hypothetical protein n=1 Tax=Mycoplasmopsis cynos TaxID=171284 RepID=UPI002AFF13B9|nr:hypothetical protein [Mycoplasmopsis cynos]WQQ15550.1 hypothetical protein RRG43_00440 [Mycoplasmopsis cynos]